MQAVVFNTSGDGYWSDVAKAVTVVDIKLLWVDDDKEFGELAVYFDKSWDVRKDGLIYTDSNFLEELQAFLNAQGLAGNDVSYSEQGMQGDNYVSCDVGEDFIAGWAKKFKIELDTLVY